MKNIVLLTVAYFAVIQLLFAQDEHPYLSLNAALPLQAAVCDVIGVGHALSQDDTNAVFQIDQFWYGSVTNNPVVLYREYSEPFPTNGTPVVFFASKYPSFLRLEPSECHYSYIFDMDYHRSRYEPDGLYLFSGERSWFPATAENTAMTAWCSNLVYVSQASTNRMAFYELIRDGYRLYPASSRISRDSDYTFRYFHYFMTTNFMHQVWSDTNLVGRARGWVNILYQHETGSFLSQ